jgi:peptidyl-prolyl cis-trans isomerase SurA
VSAEIVDKVVAIVNRKVITQYQLEQATQTFLQAGRDPAQVTREKVLNFLIEQELISQEAENTGILITDDDLNSAIEYIKRQNNLQTDDELKEALGNEGKTWEEFLNEVRKQLKIEQVISQKVRAKVEVTDAEVEAYYQENRERFDQAASTVHVRHILLEIPGNADETRIHQLQQQAQQLVQQLREGADFAEVAKVHSDHPSAESGGELGTFKQGDLAPPFDIAFTMEAGAISDPVRSDKGFHIINVQEKMSGEQVVYEQVKTQIQNALFEEKTNQRYEEWIAELEERAYVEIKE